MMNIFILVKVAGKRRDILEKKEMQIPYDIDTVEQLIEYLVRENVRSYNQKLVDAPLFKFLSKKKLNDGVYTGKIGFGDRKNETPANEETAVHNALKCFSDGIYRVLVNDIEAMAGIPLDLQGGDTITFIRLMMLAGRQW